MFLTLLLLSWLAARLLFGGRHDLRKKTAKTIQGSAYRRYASEVETGRQWLLLQRQERITVTSYDGLRLVGRFLPCKDAHGTVLLFHGWKTLAELDFACTAALYHALGLNLLLVDQRAQGDSEGHYMTFGIRESRDAERWICWHTARFGALPILLCGVSMGAATVLMAAGQPLPEQVRGVIADCGFTCPEEIFAKLAKERGLAVRPSLWLLRLLAKLYAGFGLRERSAEDCRLPLLLFHGEDDRFVPSEMSRRIYQGCTATDKTLVLVPEARHAVSCLVQPEVYQTAVRSFVVRVLKGSKDELRSNKNL